MKFVITGNLIIYYRNFLESIMPLHHVHYQNNFSAEIEEKLIELYQSAYSVKDYFYLYKDVRNINVLVIYNNDILAHVLFYTISKSDVTVLNELFSIENEYISYFTTYIFNNHKKINTIHINKLNTGTFDCAYPFKVWCVYNDFIIHLPKSFEQYKSNLGKRTRTNLQYYINKLHREFPDFSFSVQSNDSIDSSVISRIIELNRFRMKTKKIKSVFDEKFEYKIIEFSHKYGIVGSISINGQLAAGALCYKVGTSCYAHILAHEQAYDRYSIGMVCNLLMIHALIKKGVSEFHLDFGEHDYKYRFLGVRSKVSTISVFRSNLHMLFGNLKHIKKNHLFVRGRNFLKYKLIDKLRYSLLENS